MALEEKNAGYNVFNKDPKDRPFLMWFASKDAHRGWQKDELGEKHDKADAIIPPYMADMDGTRTDLAFYYDEIQRLDRYIGLIVKELKKQQVLDNTVIMFMADNGRPFPRCKTWLYDSGNKNPLYCTLAARNLQTW